MAAQGGFGLQLKINTGSLTAIVGVLEADFPEQERLVAESTGHDATSGYATWVSTGKRQLNEFTATLAWDDAQATHTAIVTNFNAEASVNMSIQDPDGAEIIAFAAFVTKIGRVSEQDGVYQAEVTFQPTGAPTIT
jgi:predicted amino acid dehydrogenase